MYINSLRPNLSIKKTPNRVKIKFTKPMPMLLSKAVLFKTRFLKYPAGIILKKH